MCECPQCSLDSWARWTLAMLTGWHRDETRLFWWRIKDMSDETTRTP
jgi:hypothetical protein